MKNDLLLNEWEYLFINFLNIIDFQIQKRIDNNKQSCYGLRDKRRVNLAGIEYEFFYSADEIIDRLENYEYDYFVREIEDSACYKRMELKYSVWSDLLQYSNLKQDQEYNLRYIDMICNHSHDINIDHVYAFLNT